MGRGNQAFLSFLLSIHFSTSNELNQVKRIFFAPTITDLQQEVIKEAALTQMELGAMTFRKLQTGLYYCTYYYSEIMEKLPVILYTLKKQHSKTLKSEFSLLHRIFLFKQFEQLVVTAGLNTGNPFQI